jgi:hypothetical protein
MQNLADAHDTSDSNVPVEPEPISARGRLSRLHVAPPLVLDTITGSNAEGGKPPCRADSRLLVALAAPTATQSPAVVHDTLRREPTNLGTLAADQVDPPSVVTRTRTTP